VRPFYFDIMGLDAFVRTLSEPLRLFHLEHPILATPYYGRYFEIKELRNLNKLGLIDSADMNISISEIEILLKEASLRLGVKFETINDLIKRRAEILALNDPSFAPLIDTLLKYIVNSRIEKHFLQIKLALSPQIDVNKQLKIMENLTDLNTVALSSNSVRAVEALEYDNFFTKATVVGFDELIEAFLKRKSEILSLTDSYMADLVDPLLRYTITADIERSLEHNLSRVLRRLITSFGHTYWFALHVGLYTWYEDKYCPTTWYRYYQIILDFQDPRDFAYYRNPHLSLALTEGHHNFDPIHAIIEPGTRDTEVPEWY